MLQNQATRSTMTDATTRVRNATPCIRRKYDPATSYADSRGETERSELGDTQHCRSVHLCLAGSQVDMVVVDGGARQLHPVWMEAHGRDWGRSVVMQEVGVWLKGGERCAIDLEHLHRMLPGAAMFNR